MDFLFIFGLVVWFVCALAVMYRLGYYIGWLERGDKFKADQKKKN